MASTRRKVQRDLDALEAGVDPALIAERTRHAQQEIAVAQAIIDSAPDFPPPLTIEEVLETLEPVRATPSMLDAADTATRTEVYEGLGLELTYRRDGAAEHLRVRAALSGVDLGRVGGALGPLRTRIELG